MFLHVQFALHFWVSLDFVEFLDFVLDYIYYSLILLLVFRFKSLGYIFIDPLFISAIKVLRGLKRTDSTLLASEVDIQESIYH